MTAKPANPILTATTHTRATVAAWVGVGLLAGLFALGCLAPRPAPSLAAVIASGVDLLACEEQAGERQAGDLAGMRLRAVLVALGYVPGDSESGGRLDGHPLPPVHPGLLVSSAPAALPTSGSASSVLATHDGRDATRARQAQCPGVPVQWFATRAFLDANTLALRDRL